METIEQNKLLKIQDIEVSLKIPEVYFNGFAIAIGAGDIVMTLTRGPHKVLQLNCSYTVAKTLREHLASLIDVLEKQTGNRIMTTDEVNAALSEALDHEESE